MSVCLMFLSLVTLFLPVIKCICSFFHNINIAVFIYVKIVYMSTIPELADVVA